MSQPIERVLPFPETAALAPTPVALPGGAAAEKPASPAGRPARPVSALWRVARHFSPEFRAQRWRIAGSLLALVAGVALRLLEPWPLKFVFDQLLDPARAKSRAAFPLLAGLEPGMLLALCALALVAITSLRALANYWSMMGFIIAGNRVVKVVRARLFRHVQLLGLGFHARSRSGDLVMRVITDMGMLQDTAVTAVMPGIAKIFILAGMAGLMLWMRWDLALVALSVLPLFWWRTTRISARIRDAARQQRKREGAMAASAAESLGAIRVVQALALDGRFASEFDAQIDQGLKEDARGKRLSAGLERSVDALVALATALVLWYGGTLVMRGVITPGDLLVFIAYLKFGFRPVQDSAKYAGRLGKAAAAGERVLALLEQVPEVRDLPGAVPAPPFRGRVQFDRVTFRYVDGISAVEGVDLNVEPGQHVVLTGASGSGKSTLASLLLRLYDPAEGSVRIDGRDMRDFTIESLRRQISVVMQENILFAASIADNIACSVPGATREQVEAAARLASAHEFIVAQPQGYDTVVAERGTTLSGGQRQRIAIARAALRHAPILILDEPTAGLDKQNERAVLDSLTRLAAGRTVFHITHDLRHARGGDLIVFLENGRIAERGTHEQLLEHNGEYARLYRMQAAAAGEDEPTNPTDAGAR